MRMMQYWQSVRITLLTLLVGGVGALLGWLLKAPVFMLLGPAIAVSIACLGGVKAQIAPLLRDGCFVILGLAVGSGFDADALAAAFDRIIRGELNWHELRASAHQRQGELFSDSKLADSVAEIYSEVLKR